MTLFWEAAQKRIAADERARLVALYRGVRDGYASAMVGAGVWKGEVEPEYLRDRRERPKLTAEDLMRDFGGVAVPFSGWNN